MPGDTDAPEWYRKLAPAPVLSAAPAYTGPLRAGAPAGTPVAAHWGLATQAAQRHGLDPSLLAAVWDFESSGNPGAINKRSGATGLGQVMPRERGFPDRPTQQELLNPETNAEWSARILKSGLQRYGSEDKALAAYLGAIDARGNITGAVDVNGTGGNQYIRTVRERQQRYAGAADTPAPSPASADQQAPAWYQKLAGNERGTTPGAPAAAAPAQRGEQPAWLRVAEQQLGKPYIWGSKGGRSDFSSDAAGFDCSGFASYVYKTALGVDLPAFTGTAYPATRAVAPQEAKAGDLVFYNMHTSDPRRQHVAIYLGDGRVIQSGGAGDGVNIAAVDQMRGAEFRRSPRAQVALSQGQARVGQDAPTTATPSGALYLQGTVAPPQTGAGGGTDVPAWYRKLTGA